MSIPKFGKIFLDILLIFSHMFYQYTRIALCTETSGVQMQHKPRDAAEVYGLPLCSVIPQAAVRCTKRCVKSHKIAHETHQNRLRLGLRPIYPARGAYDAPPDPSRGQKWGTPHPHSSPLDAFDRCSWTLVQTGRKDGHP